LLSPSIESDAKDSDDEDILILDDPEYEWGTDRTYDSEGEPRRASLFVPRSEKRITKFKGLKEKKKRKRPEPQLIKKYWKLPQNPDGTPKMPIEFRGVTVFDLGRIVWDRPRYHSKRYIWPLGYKSQRQYYSMRDPEVKVIYTSEIVDGDDEPLFIVTSEEDEEHPIVKDTPSGAWAEVGKAVSALRAGRTGRRMNTQLSGPEMFGFAYPTIAKVIQEMPGVEKLTNYEMQHYVPAQTPLARQTGAKKSKSKKKTASKSKKSSSSKSKKSKSKSASTSKSSKSKSASTSKSRSSSKKKKSKDADKPKKKKKRKA